MSQVLHTDHEFCKLVHRQSDVNLTIAALEIARDADSELDFAPTVEWVRERGRELLPEVARLTDTTDIVYELCNCLADRHSLGGNPDCYSAADSSYIHRVIETGRGIPISLSLVYMAVAEQIGLELYGVSCPAHFLVRTDTECGPLFIDCFSSGRILSESEAHEFIGDLVNDDPEQFRHSFEPARPRTIMIRALNNLKTLFASREKWNSAWQVQDRLVRLQPTSYRERRDLALISLRANRPGEAIGLIESLLKACPDTDRDFLSHAYRDAQNKVADWN